MKLFAENRNVKVVDDIEVIMRPKARLSEGMAGRIQAEDNADSWKKARNT